MTADTRRLSSRSPLPVPALVCAAGDRNDRLGLDRPRQHPNYRPTIQRVPRALTHDRENADKEQVDIVSLLALPLAGLAALVLAGSGLAVVLAPRFSHDAQAALAPLCGAAVFACASPLLPLGLPVWALATLVLVPLGALSFARIGDVSAALTAGARPFALALASLGLGSLPAIGRQ